MQFVFLAKAQGPVVTSSAVVGKGKEEEAKMGDETIVAPFMTVLMASAWPNWVSHVGGLDCLEQDR
jgi:hypothetical protein